MITSINEWKKRLLNENLTQEFLDYFMDLIEDSKTQKEALELTAQKYEMDVDDVKSDIEDAKPGFFVNENTSNIEALIFQELDTAVIENEYTELLTQDPLEVAEDLLTNPSEIEALEVSAEDLVPFIVKYQEAKKIASTNEALNSSDLKNVLTKYTQFLFDNNYASDSLKGQSIDAILNNFLNK